MASVAVVVVAAEDRAWVEEDEGASTPEARGPRDPHTSKGHHQATKDHLQGSQVSQKKILIQLPTWQQLLSREWHL